MKRPSRDARQEPVQEIRRNRDLPTGSGEAERSSERDGSTREWSGDVWQRRWLAGNHQLQRLIREGIVLELNGWSVWSLLGDGRAIPGSSPEPQGGRK